MKKRTSLMLTLLVVAAMLLPLGQASAAASVSWLQMENDIAVIYYVKGYEADARKGLAWMEYAADRVEAYLGARYARKAKVYFYPSEETFGFPPTYMDSSSALAEVRAITPTVALKTQSNLDDVYYRKNLTHEYVHLVVGQLHGNQEFPGWFREGFADYLALWQTDPDVLERYRDEYRQAFRYRLLEGGAYLSTISEFDHYRGGSEVMRFFDLTFGKERINRLVRSQKPFELALREIAGVNTRQLENVWLKWVAAEYRLPLSQLTGDEGDGGIPVIGTAYRTVEVKNYVDIPAPQDLHKVTLTPGSDQAAVDGKPVTMPGAVISQDGVTYVPLRFLAENLGAGVFWDEATGSVTVKVLAPDPIQYPHLLVHDAKMIRGADTQPMLWLFAVSPTPEERSTLEGLIRAEGAQITVMANQDEVRKVMGDVHAANWGAVVQAAIPMTEVANGFVSQGKVTLGQAPGMEWLMLDYLGVFVPPDFKLIDADGVVQSVNGIPAHE